ncbi:MAG TPA: PAS domain-containing protein, partial [Thermoanaerobaculia bacterium]|nr:PAS domain-containing protein [Thermoanaerobaculia bacterium]
MDGTRAFALSWPSTKDWVAVAELLAERGEQPLALLDRRGKILLVNRAMESALGWGRDEVEGKSWVEVFAPATQSAQIAHRLNQALAGGLRQYECEAVDREGRRVRLALELTRVGKPGQCLLVVVQRVMAVDELPAQLAQHELDYEIATAPSSFGSVQRLELVGRTVPGIGDGRRVCFELLHERQSPCEDCPVLRDGRETWPRVVVRRGTPGAESFTIVTAEPPRAGTVRVGVRFVADETLRVIHDARLAAVA